MMDMQQKALELPATIDELQGKVSGFAAIFGAVDSGGDRILPGAFKKTIQERFHKYGGIPLTWQHAVDDPLGPLGKVTVLREVGRDELPMKILQLAPDATGGLYYEGQVTMTEVNKDRMKHLVAGTVPGQSIGYVPVRESFVKENGLNVRILPEIRLYEVAAVTLGMHDAALLTEAKNLETLADATPADEPAEKAAVTNPETKAEDAGEQGDTDKAGQVIALLNQLIESEAGEMTTEPEEADDVYLLLQVRSMMIQFQDHETDEAMQMMAAAPLLHLKAGRRNSRPDEARLKDAHDGLHEVLNMPHHDIEGNAAGDSDADGDSAGADTDADAKAAMAVRLKMIESRVRAAAAGAA